MTTSADIFLSYNREDQAVARRFAEAFERAGFTVWWDVTLKSGEDYDRATEVALRNAKAVVVLWSKRSVESRWVRTEATIALQNKTLVPVMIETCQRPIMFELSQTADLSHWHGDDYDAAWRSLLGDLQKQVAGEGHSTPPTTARPAKSHVNAVLRWGGMATALLIVFASAVYVIFARDSAITNTDDTRLTASAMAEATSSNARTAVAILPFVNLTGDPANDYLGEGLSEELILMLGRVPGMTVPSRTSTFSYGGSNVDLKRIAADLGVGTVLEGSVRLAGSTIRVAATLIDAQSDRQLWSESYEREFTNLFALQDELARAIVQALQINLSVVAQPLVADVIGTRDVEAYRLYLEANYLQGIGDNLAAHARASEAIARDRNFARAYVVRAGALLTMIQIGMPASRLPEAEADLQQAMRLAPEYVDIQALLGGIASFRGEWSQAEQYFQSMLQGKPNIQAFITYAVAMESAGYLTRTGNLLEQVINEAPANPITYLIQATNYSVMGNDSLALVVARQAEDFGMDPRVVPFPQVYANAALRARRPQDAVEFLIPAIRPEIQAVGGEAMYRSLYDALANPANKPAALQQIQQFIDDSQQVIDPNTAKDVLVGLAMLGALDEAFGFANAVIDRYQQAGTVGYAWGALWLPEMKTFRQDARFQQLAVRLKLFDYWNTYGPPDGCQLQDNRVLCQ